MKRKKREGMLTPIGVLLTLMILTACASPALPATTQSPTTDGQAPLPGATGPATEPATETPAAVESSDTPTRPTAPVAGAGLCANAFYPVQEGATWTYKSTGGPAGEYSFTDTITSVHNEGFTLSTQIGSLTRSQQWTCTPEGLTALQLGGAPAAMLNSQNIQLMLDVKNVSGVTFPSQIKAGDQWQQSMDVEGNINAMNEEATATGNTQMKFSAIGTESVPVPAGTFDALKVNVDVTLNINATYRGIALPVTFFGDYTYWFAPGVGWVKASGTGNVFGSSFSETTELQSYNVP